MDYRSNADNWGSRDSISSINWLSISVALLSSISSLSFALLSFLRSSCSCSCCFSNKSKMFSTSSSNLWSLFDRERGNQGFRFMDWGN